MEYKVNSNLKHDNKNYSKGDVVEMSKEQAESLLKDNVLKNTNDTSEDEERTTPQVPVNVVNRKGGDIDGEAKVEPGKVEKPQPGDETKDESEGKPEFDREKFIAFLKEHGVELTGSETDDELKEIMENGPKKDEGDKNNAGDNL